MSARFSQVPAAIRDAALAWADAETLVLFVPYDPARTSSNRVHGHHWSRRHKEADPAQTAALWAWCEADRPQWDVPVTVDLLIARGRDLDDDNAKTGLKTVRDFLFKKRITRDDSPRWMEYGRVRWLIGADYIQHPWTVFLVRKREVGA